MGDLPHGQPHNTLSPLYDLCCGLMKTATTKTAMTFGGLVASFYHTYGDRKAKGLLRLAVKANLVVFRGTDHQVVSRVTGKA